MLKLELAQYRALEAFSMFASDLDAVSRRQLDRGARLSELLRQQQQSPYPVEDQVVSIWVGSNGYIDDIPLSDVLDFERDLLEYLRNRTSILDDLRTCGDLTDALLERLKEAVESFKNKVYFMRVDEREKDPLEDENIGQEELVRSRRAN